MGDRNKTTSEEVPQRAEGGVTQYENRCVAPGGAGLLAAVMRAQNSFTQPQQDLEPGSQQEAAGGKALWEKACPLALVAWPFLLSTPFRGPPPQRAERRSLLREVSLALAGRRLSPGTPGTPAA